MSVVCVCCLKYMIRDVWLTILAFSELGFLAFRWCVLYETDDLGCLVCYFGLFELGFLVFRRCVLPENYDLGV
jgi:hypothetical protein